MDFATIFRLEENLNLDKKTLVILRWIAIFGQLFSVNLVYFFLDLNFPVLLGASRKSFIGISLNLPENDRLEGSLAANVIGLQHGVKIFRVHDVAETHNALFIANKIFNSNHLIN